MIGPLFLLLQATSSQPADIEFRATVRARSLTIEKRGDASLVVWSEPEGRNLVDIRAPRASGRKTIRNPVVRVDVEARIAPPPMAPADPPGP